MSGVVCFHDRRVSVVYGEYFLNFVLRISMNSKLYNTIMLHKCDILLELVELSVLGN